MAVCAKRGARRSMRISPTSSAKSRRCGTAASCSGATRCLQAIASAPAISRPISQVFWPGATGAFPTPSVFNGFGMGALRCADGAFVLGEMGQHTSNAGRIYFPSGTPDLDDIRDGTVDISGSVVRELEEETGLAPGEYRERGGLALRLHRTCSRDDPHAARRYAGRSLARQDRGQSRLAAISPNCRPFISCAARAISLRQCRVLSRRSSRRSSHPNPDVQASPVSKRLRDVAASNALDIWSRYQCDRRQQEQENAVHKK